MCCRYWIKESPELRAIVEEMYRSPLTKEWEKTAKIKTAGEVRPADVVPVIASNKRGRKTVFPMKWGFTGRTTLLNARAETAGVKPTFKDAWASHRCIVPSSWYFEWEHLVNGKGKKVTGDKYAIRPKDRDMTYLCGLYRIENGLPVFVVLTREPGEEIRFIHDRMPLIMPEGLVDEWIRPDASPDRLLDSAVTDMIYLIDNN